MARKPKTTAKPQKTKGKPAGNPRQKAVAAALRLADIQGWDLTTMRDIAIEAGLSLADLYDLFESKADILVAYGRTIDQAVMAAFPDVDPETPVRDRLFDVLMERFDLINQDRAAVVSILQSFRLDPKQAVIGLPHLGASMTKMLEVAGIDTNGLRGALRVFGLQAAYICVLKTWMDDENPDLSKTMASLDKALSRVETIANSLGL